MGQPLYASPRFAAVGGTTNRRSRHMPPPQPPENGAVMRVLLISGSTREGSSNTFALRALHELDSGVVSTDLYEGLRSLPAFVPDGTVPPDVVDLLGRIQAADAIVFSSPEYAGGLPGALKNLLDWTVGGGQLYGKPVAWLDVANPGRGNAARAQLRTVLDYVGARIVENACVHVTLDRTDGAMRLARDQELALSRSTAALRAAVG
jgi:chromate reductase, NAD(P)H dehydrogenase (quinone)